MVNEFFLKSVKMFFRKFLFSFIKYIKFKRASVYNMTDARNANYYILLLFSIAQTLFHINDILLQDL